MLWQTGGIRTLLLSALAYARLVGVARSRSWVCACWSRGRAPGQVEGGSLQLPSPLLHYVAQCIRHSWNVSAKKGGRAATATTNRFDFII
jgi:hypothetical protein